MAKFILKFSNGLVSLIVALCLCLAGAYAAFALWDNSRIYAAAENVQADMLLLKPAAEEDDGASFEELLAINSDVRAWLTLDNTAIDYPVLQGETNLTYINTDVYGNFALAGSIYLDSRCDSGFDQPYLVLYGHHMANSRMFGDLDLYKEEAFFQENSTGTLILPDCSYTLDIFACMLVKSADSYIFSPSRWNNGLSGLLSYVRQNAMYVREETIAALEESENPRVIALTTCSSEFTDARTIVLAVLNPYRGTGEEATGGEV